MPVSIGGSVIAPGDIVVGDEDGVVSYPASVAPPGNDRLDARGPLSGLLRKILKNTQPALREER